MTGWKASPLSVSPPSQAMDEASVYRGAVVMTLTTRDSVAFVEALLSPDEPNEKLREAAPRTKVNSEFGSDGGGMMTKEELIRELEEIAKLNDGDVENNHSEADYILLRYINDKEVSAAFRAIKRWYA